MHALYWGHKVVILSVQVQSARPLPTGFLPFGGAGPPAARPASEAGRGLTPDAGAPHAAVLRERNSAGPAEHGADNQKKNRAAAARGPAFQPVPGGRAGTTAVRARRSDARAEGSGARAGGSGAQGEPAKLRVLAHFDDSQVRICRVRKLPLDLGISVYVQW